MPDRDHRDGIAGLLGRIRGGSAEVTVDGRPFAHLDSATRDLTVQIRALLGPGRPSTALLRERHVTLWSLRGVPSQLARSGWTLRICDGPDELVRIGRTASVLTGHVHLGRALLGTLVGTR